ncbi:MAG: hypothetical protein ACOYD7_03000 [Raoultibacter sp.]|jgi:hypothetical protein
MPFDRGRVRRGKDCFVKFPAQSYATIQEGLLKLLVSKGIGRNGWAVIVALCRTIYSDGRLGRMSSAQIEAVTGLSEYQVARGKKELRDKGVIVPVYRTTEEGYRHLDRSNFGHVAQFCFAKEVWAQIETLTNDY